MSGSIDSAIDSKNVVQAALRPSISRTVIDGYLSRVAVGDRAPVNPLTPRQREVLKLVTEGKSTKQIAATLHLSVKTVEAHRGELMRRLGIHDVAGLVKYALRHGIIAPEQ
jgi:DNA-binding NarL/FixJ family response regulator